MNLEYITKKKKSSGPYGNGKRFYTALDMSIVKKDAAIYNARVKRGEEPNNPNRYVSICGCGIEGCFIHGSYPSVSKEENQAWFERRSKNKDF